MIMMIKMVKRTMVTMVIMRRRVNDQLMMVTW